MWKIGGGRNSVWSLMYSIVRKRYKENPDQVNGDNYARFSDATFTHRFPQQKQMMLGQQ